MNQRKHTFFTAWIAIISVFMIHQTHAAIGRIIPFFYVDSRMNESSEILLIDDFSESNGISSLGSQWRMFTDRVMGGISTAEWKYAVIDGRRCVHLQGFVSLANNGGFIQIALPLTKTGHSLDASSFKGVRLWVRGNGQTYHVHLRTNDTQMPWQYYQAEFIADSIWRMVELPFSDFEPENLVRELKPDQLVRLGIVAIKKEFKADIAVARLEFYR